MKAEQLFKRRVAMSPISFVELVAWELAEPVPGSLHHYKYRLAFVHDGVCQIRYDNESGKGDHKHIGADEYEYVFSNIDQLTADFLEDVTRWQDEHSNT